MTDTRTELKVADGPKRRRHTAMCRVLLLGSTPFWAGGFIGGLDGPGQIAAMAAVVALLIALVEGGIIVGLRRRVRGLQAQVKAIGYAVKGAQTPQEHADLAALYEKALTGSLDRFSVGEVLQFFHSIRETGILDIVDDEVAAVHRLLISQGEVIDAFNGTARGEAAVSEILACESGSFTFIRGDLPSLEAVITKPTMSILMENCQSRDEAGLSLQMS